MIDLLFDFANKQAIHYKFRNQLKEEFALTSGELYTFMQEHKDFNEEEFITEEIFNNLKQKLYEEFD